MKNLRLSLAAAVLTLIMVASAFAGEIQTPIAPPPPPPPPVTSIPSTAGDISFPGVSADPVMEVALILAQSVLALF